MKLSFQPLVLQALPPASRDRLLALTLPPRHEGDESVFVEILKASEGELHVHTLALVAVDESVAEDAPLSELRWVGWTLIWWRQREQVARVGVFVASERRRESIAASLLQRIQLAAGALGFHKLRGNATEDGAARLFERFGIENDARPPCLLDF